MNNNVLRALVAGVCLSALSAVQASVMYVLDGDGNRKPANMFAVDMTTGAIVNSWSNAAPQRTFPIAVWGDVRNTGYGAGETGGLYDLNGVYQGVNYALPGGLPSLVDGTSDGSYNYAVSYNNGNVYRFDRDWTNPVTFFSTGLPGIGGISYNPLDGTFWVSMDRASGIRHYAADGTLLGSFATVGNLDWNLAFDPTTGSMWISQMSPGTGSTLYYNYAQDGTLLGQLNVAGVDATSFLSGEFDLSGFSEDMGQVPVPAALLLMVAGLAGLGISRRRIGA